VWVGARKKLLSPLPSLLVDQAAHLALVTAACLWIAGLSPSLWFADLVNLFGRWGHRIALVLLVFVVVVFAGGSLLALLLEPFAAQLRHRARQEDTDQEAAEELARAGRWIGWLERSLLLTAITLSSPAAAGLIVAAKSVFRFSETRDRPFAEYFLIGTFLSVLLAVAGGIALRIFLF
jgi:hypothetical protein